LLDYGDEVVDELLPLQKERRNASLYKIQITKFNVLLTLLKLVKI
jgi:hypothetical protein